MKKATKGEKIFYVINYILLTLIGLATLLPFLNVVGKAFSSKNAVISGQVGILPVGFQLETIMYVIKSNQFVSSFGVSVFVTAVGGLAALMIALFTAYPLSKPSLKGRKGILLMFVFIMLVHGGLVPNYILMKSLNLLDTIWVLILPSLVNVFNMLIIKTYIEGLPEGIEEAAKIDGASNLRILFQMIFPMCVPVMATVGLFSAVSYWNNFFNAMIYTSKSSLKPLQLFLYEIVLDANTNFGDSVEKSVDDMMNHTSESIVAATIVVSTIPILIVYPFLQKYFVKGIALGSVKG